MTGNKIIAGLHDALDMAKAASSDAAVLTAEKLAEIDRYGDASKAESMACVRIARAALSTTKGEPSR